MFVRYCPSVNSVDTGLLSDAFRWWNNEMLYYIRRAASPATHNWLLQVRTAIEIQIHGVIKTSVRRQRFVRRLSQASLWSSRKKMRYQAARVAIWGPISAFTKDVSTRGLIMWEIELEGQFRLNAALKSRIVRTHAQRQVRAPACLCRSRWRTPLMYVEYGVSDLLDSRPSKSRPDTFLLLPE